MTIGMSKVIKIFDLYMYMCVHTGHRNTSTCIMALRLSKQSYFFFTLFSVVVCDNTTHRFCIEGRRTQFTSTIVIFMKILCELELLKILQNQSNNNITIKLDFE